MKQHCTLMAQRWVVMSFWLSIAFETVHLRNWMFKMLVTQSAIPHSVQKGMNAHYNIPSLPKSTRYAGWRFYYMLLSKLSHNLVSAIFYAFSFFFILKKFIFSVHCHKAFGIKKKKKQVEQAHLTHYAFDLRQVLASNTTLPTWPQFPLPTS